MKSVKKWIFALLAGFCAFTCGGFIKAERTKEESCYFVEAEEKTANGEYKKENQKEEKEKEYTRSWIVEGSFWGVALVLALTVGIRGEKQRRKKKEKDREQ